MMNVLKSNGGVSEMLLLNRSDKTWEKESQSINVPDRRADGAVRLPCRDYFRLVAKM
jgi:hypothetical protein